MPADLDLDTDAGDATLPSQDTFSLNASQLGAHTVTESATAGWTLTGLDCTGGGADSSTTSAKRKATLDIDAGETVVCTFKNTKHASLKVVKVTDPASDPQDFDFDPGRRAGRGQRRPTSTSPTARPRPTTSTRAPYSVEELAKAELGPDRRSSASRTRPTTPRGAPGPASRASTSRPARR